ncbi:GGDEF domain-containing protein [Gammaproteobacteria bacterium LSUCC0112]|nr:GGDEF domain-containing protein [Gammaproteobacteria bacterium LSUCC0112]
MAHWPNSEKIALLSGQERHQAKMIHVLLMVMAVYFAVLAALNVFVFNDFYIAAMDTFGLAGSLYLIAYFRRTTNLKVTSWSVVLILTAILMLFIHLTAGMAYSIIWVTVLPPISFFLLGRRYGAWVCGVVFSYVVAFFYFQTQTTLASPPGLASVLNIAEVLLAHWFLFRFYERSRAEAYAELERLSETDKLTGLYNRRHLDLLLTKEFNLHLRSQRPLTLVLCDIDHFKRINDKNGHLTGDIILQEIAETIRSTMRNTDLYGRWGGEEFLFICPDTSGEAAIAIVEKLRHALATRTFTRDIKVTLSFGIAISAQDQDAEQQLRRADEALYEAKHRGRNCFVVAEDTGLGQLGVGGIPPTPNPSDPKARFTQPPSNRHTPVKISF